MPTPTSITLLAKHVERAVSSTLQRELAAVDMSLEQWHVLYVLLHNQRLPMAELGELAALPPASLTRHMDRLVEHGQVVRQVDPSDRRKVVATLTPRGRVVTQNIAAAEEQAYARLAETLGLDAPGFVRQMQAIRDHQSVRHLRATADA